MQQHNGNWGSLLCQSPETAAVPSNRLVRLEQTPAYHRSKQPARADSASNLDRDLSQPHSQALLEKALGDCRFSAIDPVTELRCQAHPLQTSNLHLVDFQWQGAFKLEQAVLNEHYIFYIVGAGSLTQKIAAPPEQRSQQHQTLCCSATTATIGCPGQIVESIASDRGQALLIALDRDSIESAMSKLLVGGVTPKGHRPLKQPVIFDPSIDLTSELGLSMKKFSQFLWEAAANHAADFSSLVLQKLEATFLACAIEGLPSNYSEELLYQTDGALAYHVRKARAFIESHLHEDITLGDIAAATSVCSRLLQKAFAHHCGCSPMRFLTQTRLQRIRQELERSTADTKIVDVMMQYGFTQGGKFAKEYQQLFGEKPSDTLKRSHGLDRQNPPLWHEIDDPLSARIVGGRFAKGDATRTLQMDSPSECLSSNSLGRMLHARALPDCLQTLLAKIDAF
jgi:AraC-like DNA-binding protein